MTTPEDDFPNMFTKVYDENDLTINQRRYYTWHLKCP